MEGDWVSFQCDDKVFRVKGSSIAERASGSLFDVMLLGTGRSECDRNENHPDRPIILDRTAKYVEPIVNFIRTNEMIIDSGVSRRGVLLEAQYFGVDAAVRVLGSVEPEFVDESETTKLRVAPSCCTRADITTSLRTMPPDTGLRLRGMCLNRVSFAKLDLRNTSFEFCSLIECDFSDCDLSKCCLSNADATGSNFARAKLCRAICLDAKFEHCSFTGASCVDSNFSGSCMIGVDASYCDFSRSVLINCDLSHANMQGTALNQTLMRFVKLEGVERYGASLSMGGVIG